MRGSSPELDTLLELEFRLQQNLNMVRRRIEALSLPLGEVATERHLRLVVDNGSPDGAA